MKSTDVVKPSAMATPIAINGSKDIIPQLQANVQEPWFCSIEQGFPDITMTALNQGGRPPRGQGMNGLLNLATDQKVYLQNGGIITFDENVSTKIGGYPQGAVLDYINNDTYSKVISLIDDNTVNFLINGIDGTNWQYLNTSGGGGGGDTYANIDLSNLTANGNAKFQFAPFAINNGVTDDDGVNTTLSTVGDAPVTVEKYVIPVMSSNTETDVSVSVSGANLNTGSPFLVTNSDVIWWYSAYGEGRAVSFTFTFMEAIPQNAVCTFTVKGNNGFSTGCNLTFNYSDNTSSTVWSTNNLGSNLVTETITATKEVVSATVSIMGNSASSSSTACYTYLGNVTLKAQYTITSTDTLICNPCTITTADSRSKTFTADNLLDCSNEADGTYKVMKSYTDGSLSLKENLTVSKTEPVGNGLNVNITGTLTDNDGVLSGFSTSNYAALPEQFIPASSGKNFEIVISFETTNTSSTQCLFSDGYPSSSSSAYGISIQIYNGQCLLYLSPTASSEIANGFNISANTKYWAKFTYDGTTYQFSYSTDGNTYTSAWSSSNSMYWQSSNNISYIGIAYHTADHSYYSAAVSSKIYINEAYIKINGSYWWKGALNNSDGDLWLDNSKYPLVLKEYDGTESEWVLNNDLVYIGDVTVASGVITAIKNRYFNACPAIRLLVDSYQNGASGCDIYSDGYCVQRGLCTSGTAVTLLKSYRDNSYALTVTYSAKTAGDFTPSQTGNWISAGYIE